MKEEQKIPMEVVHKEIDLIQSCISRMANNSFLLKGWLITLVAVILTILPEEIDYKLVLVITFMIIISFWYLDAFFLATERQYRLLYKWVLEERPKGNDEKLYDLNSSRFNCDECKISKVMVSKTLRWFYGIPMAIIIVITLYNLIIFLILLNENAKG